VLNTTEDPVYQTMQQGLAGYRFDVPDGDYEIELRFVEYEVAKPGQRVFSLAVNGESWIRDLDLAKEYGGMQPVVLRSSARASGGEGVRVDFTAVVGRPVLSAIRVRRLR
jgi:beta-galactosidase